MKKEKKKQTKLKSNKKTKEQSSKSAIRVRIEDNDITFKKDTTKNKYVSEEGYYLIDDGDYSIYDKDDKEIKVIKK